MSTQTNTNIYETMLDDEGFINDCWNKYGIGDKIDTLKLSGWTNEMFLQEWTRVNGEVEGDESDNQNGDSNLEIEQ